MEWIEALRGTVVGLDTAPLIYFIEENSTYLPYVRPFFEAVDHGEFRVTTSVLTLTEVLVHPMRQGDHELAEQYRRILLRASQITIVPVSETIAEEAAQMRARHGLRTPDAIQIATCYWLGSILVSDQRHPPARNRLPENLGIESTYLNKVTRRFTVSVQ
jgi:predicted nucleic acid-binding protein